MTREDAALMVAGQALNLSNFHRCQPGAPAGLLARIWGDDDHALADAEHLLSHSLDDLEPMSVQAFQVINALVAIRSAMEIREGGEG